MEHPRRRRAEILVDGETKPAATLGMALVVGDDPVPHPKGNVLSCSPMVESTPFQGFG